MTSTPNTHDHPHRKDLTHEPGLAATVLLLIAGALQILQGISAVAAGNLYLVGDGYLFKFDTAAWGWIHIAFGTLLALAGFALTTDTTWSRIAAISLAALSILANFLWLPYYPIWSILIIAVDVVVVCLIATRATDAV